MAEFLLEAGHSLTLDPAAWNKHWGVGDPAEVPGGYLPPQPPRRGARSPCCSASPASRVARWARPRGWIHRAMLKMAKVEMLGSANYERITPEGLFVTWGEKRENGQLIEADTIVLCAGQEPLRELQAPLQALGIHVQLIGGALEAGELDAKRAIPAGHRGGGGAVSTKA